MTLSRLTDHTGCWLRMVSNAVSQEFARKVTEEDVAVAEWAFLRALHDLEPAPPSLLAERMGMTKGAIRELSDRLEANGLAARSDGRPDRQADDGTIRSPCSTREPIKEAGSREATRIDPRYDITNLCSRRRLQRSNRRQSFRVTTVALEVTTWRSSRSKQPYRTGPTSRRSIPTSCRSIW
jgi:hypothetical protein